jgi:hypothetical protein
MPTLTMFQDQIQELLHKKKLNGISAKKLSKKLAKVQKAQIPLKKNFSDFSR